MQGNEHWKEQEDWYRLYVRIILKRCGSQIFSSRGSVAVDDSIQPQAYIRRYVDAGGILCRPSWGHPSVRPGAVMGSHWPAGLRGAFGPLMRPPVRAFPSRWDYCIRCSVHLNKESSPICSSITPVPITLTMESGVTMTWGHGHGLKDGQPGLRSLKESSTFGFPAMQVMRCDKYLQEHMWKWHERIGEKHRTLL